ncbi:MAG: SAM-dependent methyltransferase [Gallionella sp.]|nr:SAM-dependent methyltransferase [Gallionella sp.]
MLPEDTLVVMTELIRRHGQVDMVGDGINDAPALSKVSIGFAMVAAGTDTAIETADVALMDDDITRAEFPEHCFDIWHDRAVFHFLTDPADRHAYVERVMHAVRLGGHVIVATFATDGPEKCSGLPVMRYQPESLHAEFGDAFMLVTHENKLHHTPFGTDQQFVYCYCRKGGS